MTMPAHAYLLAMASAGATSAAALPFWRRWCLRHGVVDEPGARKIHNQPLPLAGGLAVMTGLAAAALGLLVLWRWGARPVVPPFPTPVVGGAPEELGGGGVAALLRQALRGHTLEWLGLLLGALGMWAVGSLDDRRELRPRVKFAGQFLVAALVAASGVRPTLFGPSLVLNYAVTILWTLTVVNAFNFTDNMNGLCAGLGAIGASWFAVYAVAGSQCLAALLALSTAGALLGFLPHNFPKARAFLGDAGSHLVGYLLAVLAMLAWADTTPQRKRHCAVLVPLCVLAVPLADLVQVVIVRWRLGKPFYVGDTNHLSHRLVRLGLSPTLAVLVLWLAAALAGALALWCCL